MDVLEYNVAEFASRWRRELDPEGVAKGKSLKKYLGKGQWLDDATLEKVNRRLMSSQVDAKALRKGIEIEIDNRNDKGSRSFNKKGTYTQNGLVAPKDRDYRRKSLLLDREIRTSNAKTSASKKRVAAFEEQLKNQSKKPKIEIDKPEIKTKYNRQIFVDANHRKEVLTNVAKKKKFARAIRTSGKLGIGAAGLLAGGALAYGLARKIRSDKGKKRKFFNR